MSKLRKLFLCSFLFLSIAAFPIMANAQVLVDLYQCIDSTGSLTDDEFDAQVDGLSAALGTVFTPALLAAGSVRFTIIRLRGPGAGQTDLLFGPSVMDAAGDVTAAQNAINISLQSAGGTCFMESTVGSTTQNCCIDYAAALATANPLPGDPLRIIDITSDGEPNQGLTNASTMNTRATTNYGFDAVNMMGINLTAPAQTFAETLTNGIGFIIPVSEADDQEEYEEAFSMKIVSETTMGCCVVDNMCTVDTTQGQCETQEGIFEEDGSCGEGACTVQPVGCCLDDNMCQDQVLQNQCNGVFDANTSCGEGECVVQPVGCCLDDNMCSNGVLQNQCSGVFNAGTSCGSGECIVQPVGCCLDDNMCSNGVLQNECSGVFNADTSCGEGECIVQPVGCCLDSNMCQDGVLQNACSGVFNADTSCGEGECIVEPVGCCVEDNICLNTVLESDCNGIFDADTSCGDGECAAPPTGCCVCGFEACTITTEGQCTDMGGDCEYQGDDTNCNSIDECSNVPGCCILGGGVEADTSTKSVDPTKCLQVTATECNDLNGDFQGPGTDCENYTDQCSIDPTNVPTIGQWGMIALAGLLGIFSLLIIMRRHKYDIGER
jgi:hypothetical protein